jgi:hypothetical protein
MADGIKANGGPTGLPGPTGFELWGPALAGAARWNGRMYEGAAMLGNEWLDFVNRRLKEDLNFPHRVCACRTAEEVRDTYASFWRRAMDDYQREFTVMARLGSGLVASSINAAQSRAEEAAREFRQPFAAAA